MKFWKFDPSFLKIRPPSCARLLAILFSLVSAFAVRAESVDLLVFGDIYTVDGARSWATAMAVKDGKIVYVGPAKGAGIYRAKAKRVLDLKPGQMVIPGIHDTHVHLLDGGLVQNTCLLFGLKTREAILEKLTAYAEEHPGDSWLLGSGWSVALYPDSNPRKEELDRLFPNRPVWLLSDDGHSGWANSAALRLAGITKDSPPPAAGRIERDPKTGEPTGTLRDAATDLVDQIAPKPPDAAWDKALLDVQRHANSLGITSIQDAYVAPRLLETYFRIAKQNALTVKIVAALGTDPTKPDAQFEELLAQRKNFSTGRLRATSVKLFADGGLEARTAALLEPYTDDPSQSGDLNWPADRFARAVEWLDKEGFQIHIHVIGDRAARVALDAIQAAQKTNGVSDNRHQLTHLQLVAPGDIPRFRQLGVIANFEPFWFFADQWINEEAGARVGADRVSRMYPIRAMLDSGAVVSAGSDWTVSSLNPFEAMQVALTRRPIDNPSAPAWLPNERVSLPELLAAYTINGAYANHQDDVTGSLEPGKAADFLVLDRHLFAVPPSEIGTTRVLRTFVDGEEVYHAPES
jgi:predicted amidohydrolase YtcJ